MLYQQNDGLHGYVKVFFACYSAQLGSGIGLIVASSVCRRSALHFFCRFHNKNSCQNNCRKQTPN